MGLQRIRLGEFTFDPTSGELRRLRQDGTAELRRLPPQPTRLLSLLAARPGEVVSRDALQQTLWPDVQVEFDQGLHFCIRQVRAALDDSAAAPRYIETIPRRGYRLVAQVEPLADEVSAGPGKSSRVRFVVGTTLLLAVLTLVVIGLRLDAGPTAYPRVAILPFRSPAGFPAPASHGHLAESILLQVDRVGHGRLELVGPTTTSAYSDDAVSIGRLIDDLGVDYLVHGRYLHDPSGPRLLAELIRASDGVHVWVHAFDAQEDPATIAAVVADALAGLSG